MVASEGERDQPWKASIGKTEFVQCSDCAALLTATYINHLQYLWEENRNRRRTLGWGYNVSQHSAAIDPKMKKTLHHLDFGIIFLILN